MFAVVPRDSIRRLVPYAIVFGGIVDAFWLLTLTYWLGIAAYINFGPFGFLGIPFFPLLAWSFFFITYLYLLPEKYPWNWVFTITAAGFSIIFSNVLQNLGIFVWRTNRLAVPMIVYLTWMIFATYTYQRFFAASKTSA
jgi:hypothetical protein